VISNTITEVDVGKTARLHVSTILSLFLMKFTRLPQQLFDMAEISFTNGE
jgi:hypothetical protein